MRFDKKQWGNLVSEYQEAIFAYCYHILGSRAEAEDACHDTFVKAFEHLDALSKDSALKSWIYSIARNVCLDRHRWWKRWSSSAGKEEPSQLSAQAPDPHLAMALEREINLLPLRQREVFVLRHFHGFTTNETARLLNCDAGTVKSHLKRAVDKLKLELKDFLP